MPCERLERVIDLPNGLDLDKLTAVLHDGVLDIRIPLSTAVKPRQIPLRTEEDPWRTDVICVMGSTPPVGDDTLGSCGGCWAWTPTNWLRC